MHNSAERAEEQDDLEPWESDDSRFRRSAWMGTSRKDWSLASDARAELSSSIPASVLHSLVLAASQQIEQQLVNQQLKRELDELRVEMANVLRSVSINRGEQQERDRAFDSELAKLEELAVNDSSELPAEYDLGSIVNEWE